MRLRHRLHFAWAWPVLTLPFFLSACGAWSSEQRTAFQGYPLESSADGVLIDTAPVQTAITPLVVHQDDRMKIVAVARYDIKARVLHTESYWADEESSLVPEDVALGWQAMSSNRLLNDLYVQQQGRFYYWWPRTWTVPLRTVELESANNHLIPSSPAIMAQIRSLQKGQLVEIKGFLVDVTKFPDWHWDSSLTREDVGEGACELIYVTELTWLQKEPVRRTPWENMP